MNEIIMSGEQMSCIYAGFSLLLIFLLSVCVVFTVEKYSRGWATIVFLLLLPLNAVVSVECGRWMERPGERIVFDAETIAFTFLFVLTLPAIIPAVYGIGYYLCSQLIREWRTDKLGLLITISLIVWFILLICTAAWCERLRLERNALPQINEVDKPFE